MKATVLAMAAGLCVASVNANAQSMLTSYYGAGEPLKHLTASGRPFNRREFTAAHPYYPYGTVLRVCSPQRCVRVVVNDRGPAAWTGRGLDVTRAAAQALGFIRRGVAWLNVTIARS